MKLSNKWSGVVVAGLLLACGSVSQAAVPYTETFTGGANGWLNGASAALNYQTSGGPDGTSYVSYTTAVAYPAEPPMFGSPLALLFRGNNAQNASNDAFVGNWLTADIETLELQFRHDAGQTLLFYSRIAGTGGAGASLSETFSVPSGVWTKIVIPIVDSNPPFLSYGSSTFNGVFSNVQNLQFGVYIPVDFNNPSVTFDLDNVHAVPEPASLGLMVLGGAALLRRRRQVK